METDFCNKTVKYQLVSFGPFKASANESMGVLELFPAEDLPWKMRQVGNITFWDCTAEHCYKLRVIQQNPSACRSASSVSG